MGGKLLGDLVERKPKDEHEKIAKEVLDCFRWSIHGGNWLVEYSYKCKRKLHGF